MYICLNDQAYNCLIHFYKWDCYDIMTYDVMTYDIMTRLGVVVNPEILVPSKILGWQ